MLAFRDFVPRQLRAPHLGISVEAVQGEYETLESALNALNQWRDLEKVRVLNVETVVLPNLDAKWEEGTNDPVLGASGAGAQLWYQFFRVWYEADDAGQ